MTPTPAQTSSKGFDMHATYEFDSREYWIKRATRRQQVIRRKNDDIRALEKRLFELEDEISTLKMKGKNNE